jgi:translation initiation factor 3 subunit I
MKVSTVQFHERPLTLVKFNQDGDFFITCAKDGEVALVRTETSELVGTFNPTGNNPGAIYAIDITKDSQFVVIAGADGRLIFFKFSGEQIAMLNHGGILKYVEFNQKPGCQNMVVTCNDKFKSQTEGAIANRLVIWQWQNSKGEPKFEKLLTIAEDLPMKATKVKWGAYDETIISIHEEGTVYGWETQKGAQIFCLQAHNSPVTGFNFDRDRMLMITCSKDHTAKLWALDEVGEEEREPELVKTYKTDRPLNDAAIYPLVGIDSEVEPKYHVLMGGGQDAKDVTTTGGSGKFEATLWHMIYEEEIGSIKGHFSPINTVAWFPDGRGFVTGAEEGIVRVVHLDNDYFTKKPFE